jgi:hypothetical protein
LYDFELDEGDTNTNTTYNTYLDLSSISINLPAVMMVGHNRMEQLEVAAGGERAERQQS